MGTVKDGMYGDRVELYDLVYGSKDYASEARGVADLLEGLGVPTGSRVLEGGCGTGGHLVHLRSRYDVAGFDLSEDMVRVARTKLPGVRLWTADLADFTVERPVDAFVCLFSAIGYLLGEERLRACARAAAAAVRPGGVVVIEPWLAPEIVDAGRPSLDTARGPDVHLARACVSELEGDVLVLPFTWVVARRGRPVETFTEVHRLWCAPTALVVAAFADAGFDARFEPGGLTARGLVVGVRR